MAEETAYQAQLMAARLRQLNLIGNQTPIFDKVLQDSSIEIGKLLEGMAGANDTIKIARLTALKRELDGIIDNTVNDISNFIVKDIGQSAQLATNGRINAGMALLYDMNPELAQAIPRAFAKVPIDAVRAVLARAGDDGKTFSDRIWDLRNRSKSVITETVARGVVQGTSARNLAKQVEPYLRGMEEIKGKYTAEEQADWANVWKQQRRKYGDMRYNSMRLARTENNNAFREAGVMSAEKAPWVEGVKWNLSASHPKVDICDVYASQDVDGLGKGVYKPMNTPRDHPNGLCFLTDKVVSREQLRDIVRQQTREILLAA